MQLTHLKLLHFRNYPQLSVAFKFGCNLILGANGQGKTNLLEAIALLSQGRSFRSSEDAELICRQQGAFQPQLSSAPTQTNSTLPPVEEVGAPYARVLGTLHNPVTLDEETVDLRWTGAPRTAQDPLETLYPGERWRYRLQVKRNDKALKSRHHLLGQFATVSFVLSDLLLLRGTPSDRRNWLDKVVAQLQPSHAQILQAYNRVVKQKSQWLKQQQKVGEGSYVGGSHGQTTAAVLDSWNQQLAGLAVPVWQARWQTLLNLLPQTRQVYAALCQEQDPPVWLGYGMVGQLGEELGHSLESLAQLETEALEQTFLTHLTRLQKAELARGHCLIGPHRDEVLVALGSPEWLATRYASQGQQRSLILALKLAELDWLLASQGQPPVLLLDDVMAELDASRQQVLLQELGRVKQVFLTTTHVEQPVLYPLLENRWEHPVQVFEVDQGQISCPIKFT